MRCSLCGYQEMATGRPEIPPEEWLCPACGSKAEERELHWFLAHLARLPDGSRVLDVGPSPAQIRQAPRNFSACRYTAIDSLPRGDEGGLKPPHRFLQMDVTRLTFSEQAFDAVLCQHVLAEIRSDYMAMWEIHRVLRNDGFAVLTEPLFAGKTERFTDWRGTKVPDSVGRRPLAWAYGEDYVERLEAAGFFVHRMNLSQWAGAAAAEYAFRPEAELVLGFKFRVALRGFLEAP